MLSERERRQFDDIEHDLLRDPDFAAAVADIVHGPPRSLRRIMLWAVVLVWVAATVTGTVTGHYTITVAVALAGAVACVIHLAVAARRRTDRG